MQDSQTNLVEQLQGEWSKQVIHTSRHAVLALLKKTVQKVVIGGIQHIMQLILTAKQNTLGKTLKNYLVCNTLKQYAC